MSQIARISGVFKFAPNTPMRNAYKQVGNSVCVPVIKRIAEKIKASMGES